METRTCGRGDLALTDITCLVKLKYLNLCFLSQALKLRVILSKGLLVYGLPKLVFTKDLVLLDSIITHDEMTLGFVWSGFFTGALAFKK